LVVDVLEEEQELVERFIGTLNRRQRLVSFRGLRSDDDSRIRAGRAVQNRRNALLLMLGFILIKLLFLLIDVFSRFRKHSADLTQ